MTTTWADEQRTVRDITRQQAAGIATALGEGWAVDTSPKFDEFRCVYLDGPTGERLAVGLMWRDHDRLVISGVYPRHDDMSLPSAAKTYEITVSRSRAPDAIAKDINRRLLPQYLIVLDAVREAYDETALALVRRTALAKRLDGRVPGHLQSESSTTVIANIGDVRVLARLGYRGDNVNFELSSVPAELAVRIMDLIRSAS